MSNGALLGILAEIDEATYRHGRSVLSSSLRTGLTLEQGTARFVPIGFDSSELLDLYCWHDGTETDGRNLGDFQLFPGFYFLSSDDALANYAAFVHDPRWRREWLPVFADGGGDFYLLDMTDQLGVIRRFRLEEVDHPVEFLSVAAMMTTISRAYTSGVLYVDSSGYLEMDDEHFATLAARLNPEIEWWRS